MTTSPPVDRERRELVRCGLASLLHLTFIETVLASGAASRALTPALESWLRSLHERSADLRGAAIPQTHWQEQVTALLERVPLEDLAALIDLDALIHGTRLPEDRAATADPVFPALEGVPRFGCIRRVFLLARGRAIVPHGHRNMVSGHLVIHGALRVRHFDRVRDEPGHLLLRPTIDRLSMPGRATAVSDDRDNVHWLVATSPVAATFDVIVTDLDPSRPTEFTDFVDPRRGEQVGGGLIRAPRLGAKDVFARYGRGPVDD